MRNAQNKVSVTTTSHVTKKKTDQPQPQSTTTKSISRDVLRQELKKSRVAVLPSKPTQTSNQSHRLKPAKKKALKQTTTIEPKSTPKQKSAPKQAAALKQQQMAQPSQEQSNTRLLQLLIALEKEVRQVENIKALKYLAANETRKLIAARQIYLFEATYPDSDKFQVKAISSVTTPDRNLPVIQWFERMSHAMSQDVGSQQANIFTLPSYCADDQEIQTYPFAHMLWIPLKAYDGKVFGGLMLARERQWEENDQIIGQRLGDIYAHAWSALLGRSRLSKPKRVTSKMMIGTALAIFLAGFIPVPMNTLAPVEVVAQNPVITAAPIDGVIDQIFVKPNSMVKKGQPLFQFVNTSLRNDYEISKRAVVVAEAKYRKAVQGSFAKAEAKHDIATAKAELALKKSERDFAKENFEKSVVWAAESGLAVFHSKEQWLGSPVKTGEKIMTIVSPKNAELRVDLPVSDAIVLKEKARVKVFLDSDPLNPIEARMTHASYHATPTQDQQLAYRVNADFSDKTKTPPRIGLRGTAQVFGEKTSLFFYLFRRPIAATRQMFGL